LSDKKKGTVLIVNIINYVGTSTITEVTIFIQISRADIHISEIPHYPDDGDGDSLRKVDIFKSPDAVVSPREIQ
jgi:hypothetical protein